MINNRFNDPNYIDLELEKDNIIKLHTSGKSFSFISKIYNVSSEKISRVLKRWILDGKESNFKPKRADEIQCRYISKAKERAKKKNLECSISKQDIFDLYIEQNYICNISGQNLYFDSSGASFDGNVSIDRIDPKKGYIKENCQLLTKQVNNAKHDRTEEETIKMSYDITETNNKKALRIGEIV